MTTSKMCLVVDVDPSIVMLTRCSAYSVSHTPDSGCLINLEYYIQSVTYQKKYGLRFSYEFFLYQVIREDYRLEW
jgi:hypothetical protein